MFFSNSGSGGKHKLGGQTDPQLNLGFARVRVQFGAVSSLIKQGL